MFGLLAAESGSDFNLKKVWQDIVTFFTTKYWNIILFFAILVIGIIVVKLLVKLARRLLARSKMEKIAQSFVVSLLKYLLYLTLALVLLAVIGITRVVMRGTVRHSVRQPATCDVHRHGVVELRERIVHLLTQCVYVRFCVVCVYSCVVGFRDVFNSV